MEYLLGNGLFDIPKEDGIYSSPIQKAGRRIRKPFIKRNPGTVEMCFSNFDRETFTISRDDPNFIHVEKKIVLLKKIVNEVYGLGIPKDL